MNEPHRRSLRLSSFDYADERAYFVTICTYNRDPVLGEVAGEAVRLSAIGEIAREEWLKTAELRPYVILDAFVIMPDHMHAILFIDHRDDRWRTHAVGAQRAAPNSGSPAENTPVTFQLGEQVSRAQRAAPLQTESHIDPDVTPKVTPQSLGAIIRAYKSAVTNRVNDLRGTPGAPLWQRNYYDHVIRAEDDLNAIRTYIDTNPARWATEHALENPVWNRMP